MFWNNNDDEERRRREAEAQQRRQRDALADKQKREFIAARQRKSAEKKLAQKKKRKDDEFRELVESELDENMEGFGVETENSKKRPESNNLMKGAMSSLFGGGGDGQGRVTSGGHSPLGYQRTGATGNKGGADGKGGGSTLGGAGSSKINRPF